MSFVIEEEAVDKLPISIDPEIMSGTPVFEGTRVPVDGVLNNLEAGVSLDEFLENFSTVTREQALAVLEFSHDIIAKIAQRPHGATNAGRTHRIQRLPPSRGSLGRARKLMAENEMPQRE